LLVEDVDGNVLKAPLSEEQRSQVGEKGCELDTVGKEGITFVLGPPFGQLKESSHQVTVMEIVENFKFIGGNIIGHEMARWVLILVRVNANGGA